MHNYYISYSNTGCPWVNFHRIERNWQKSVPHFAGDPLDPPFRAPGGPRTPIWGSPSSHPPSEQPHRALSPASVQDSVMQGLTWWRGAPEAVTHGGSQWGLPGETRRKPRLRSRLGKTEEDSNNRRVSAIIFKQQLLESAPSAFISNLRLACFLRIFSNTPYRLENCVCVRVCVCMRVCLLHDCFQSFLCLLTQKRNTEQTEFPFCEERGSGR